MCVCGKAKAGFANTGEVNTLTKIKEKEAKGRSRGGTTLSQKTLSISTEQTYEEKKLHLSLTSD